MSVGSDNNELETSAMINMLFKMCGKRGNLTRTL